MLLIDAAAEIECLLSEYCKKCERRKPYPIMGIGCTPCWVKDAIEILGDAPEIDAKPVRHRRWIDIGNNAGMRCSECRYKIRYKNGIKTIASSKIPGGYYDYCPHCGARMDGGAEDG